VIIVCIGDAFITSLGILGDLAGKMVGDVAGKAIEGSIKAGSKVGGEAFSKMAKMKKKYTTKRATKKASKEKKAPKKRPQKTIHGNNDYAAKDQDAGSDDEVQDNSQDVQQSQDNSQRAHQIEILAFKEVQDMNTKLYASIDALMKKKLKLSQSKITLEAKKAKQAAATVSLEPNPNTNVDSAILVKLNNIKEKRKKISELQTEISKYSQSFSCEFPQLQDRVRQIVDKYRYR